MTNEFFRLLVVCGVDLKMRSRGLKLLESSKTKWSGMNTLDRAAKASSNEMRGYIYIAGVLANQIAC